ncbi:MAG: DUF3347 domain-containing protein [Ignavibacteria bacterium]|nr:DUF3347 domain-containing protein [Ignavibacteria bacterium]
MKTIIIIATVLLAWHLGFAKMAAQDGVTDALVGKYEHVKNALVQDDAKAAKIAALEFLNFVKGATQPPAKIEAEKWNTLKKEMTLHVAAISRTEDIEAQRDELMVLSTLIWNVVKNSTVGKTVYYQYCPMKKAYWVSTTAAIENPYYGQSMLTCGKTNERHK